MNVPLYRRVYEELKERIGTGPYGRGAALPSENRLSEEFGVSLITVRRALHELELDGLLERRQGLGNFVRDKPQHITIGMSSFTSDVAAGRLRLVRTLLADDMIPASAEVGGKLRVQPGSGLRHLMRLDTEGGVPLSVDEVLIPPWLAGGITTEIASSPLFMHLWQEQVSTALVQTDYDIRVQMPEANDREWLQIDADVPLLVTNELVFDANGRPSAYITTRYRSDRCRLVSSVVLVQTETEHGVVGE